LKCNATLAGLPGFDLPKVRAQGGKPVVCGKCGAPATDARIACLGCDQSFPRPFRLEEEGYDPEFENSPAIAYYIIRSDEDACDACREMNGVCFTREKFPEYRMPIKGCKNAICWCDTIGIYADEGAYFSYEPDRSKRAVGSQPAAVDRQSACAICGKPLTLVPNLFNRTVHDHCRETHGYIGKFKLTGWWFSAFTEEERQYIEMAFQPMGFQLEAGGTKPNADENSLLTGSRGVQIYGRAGSFLANLAEWLNKPETRHLARRILEHAEAIAQEPVEKHDVYQVMIVVYYRDREKSPDFFEAAISACQKQISIAPDAIREWGKTYPGVLPTHRGYEQLAIIREKQGDFAEAIRLSEEAMKQGWEPKGAWQHRIQRCNLKRRLARAKGLP
jgi:tetratricopeptide (TPR) repeat protein